MFHLDYLGKQLPLKVDYYVLKKLAAAQGKTKLSDLGTLNMDDIDAMETFCFYALERGHKKDSKPFLFPYYGEAMAEDGQPYKTLLERPLQQSDVEEILSECFAQFMLIVSESYPQATGEATEPAPEETSEKKS